MNSASDPETTTGQVLKFTLGSEACCVSIDHVTEIVDMGEITAVPNAPAHVEGVMDLRGNTTSIVDPKRLLNLKGDGEGRRIVVFDPDLFEDGRTVGWVVDTVREVMEVPDTDVEDSPFEDEHIEGIVKQENGFVVWVDPCTIHD